MTNLLGNLISRGEGGYNSYNRGTHNGQIVPAGADCDFSLITLEELTRRQSLPLGDPAKVFAVGKYQIIPTTMRGAFENLHLDANERYTPEVQEKIFADYLIKSKRHPIYDYIVRKEGSSLHAAQKAASQEWASIDDPDTPGKPYGDYARHGNRSTIRAASIAGALDGMRDAYQAATRQGGSESDAWRLVTGQLPDVRKEHTVRQHAASWTIDEAQGLNPLAHNPVKVQQSLRALGYLGSHGHTLIVDGRIGPDTFHAIKSFQQAHHLHPDGVAGPHTLAALDEAKRYPLLSEATNPHHRIYQKVLDGIHKLPHGQQPKGQHLESVAVALTLSAQGSGLHQVDHVVLGTNGVNLFAVQGRMDDPGHRRVHVELAHAATHAFDHQPTPQPAPAHAQAITAVHLQTAQRGPLMVGP